MSINSAQANREPVVGPENWVEVYGDSLYRYAKKRLQRDNDAEEAVQETFLAAIRAQQQFTGAGSQEGWLLSILRNKIVDIMRLRERHALVHVAAPVNDPTRLLFDVHGTWRPGTWADETAPQAFQLQELWQIVKICLGQIPRLQADVFILNVLQEMDVDSICHELKISPSNLRVRMHRARLSLADCVRGKWYESGESR